ncbi:hypothetical protein [Pseudooceanicola aestuarii]|uniref:hypothetical protein n=1 Tax=Pseudooceanicola aestuarii TaxID=2697319 RepID=UPI0013D33A58|nr:hypothetical protein [Pseudooceanicola aestuarii]
MIALNQVRADLTLAAAWCELCHPRIAGRPVYGHVFALRSGRTRVTPMVDIGGAALAEAEGINALASACLELLGYAPLDFGVQPDRIRATLIRIETRSNHDRAAALRHFSGLGLTG